MRAWRPAQRPVIVPPMLELEDGRIGHFAPVARCAIDVHLGSAKARVRSTLCFASDVEVERALFSLVGIPQHVSVDGDEVGIINTSGATRSVVWALDCVLPAGSEVIVESRLVGVFRTTEDGLLWCAQTNDGDSDPHYLDRIAAAGFEHDSYPVSMRIHGVPPDHRMFANGAVTRADDVVTVQFPAWYSPSCQWWVLAPPSVTRYQTQITAPWRAQDGSAGDTLRATFLADEPVDLDDLTVRVERRIANLCERFGPWPHSTVQVYLTNTQNMEYAGATCTTLHNLEHELVHSFFGRCILPNDGAAGWIDESIVTWLDTPPTVREISDLPETGCGIATPWRRGGSRAGYVAGAALLALAEHRFEETERSVDGFLRELLSRYRWTQIQTPLFLELLHDYAGEWVAEAAARCILNPNG